MLRDEALDALIPYLTSQVGAAIREKKDASEMQSIAQVFGALHLAQGNLPNAEEFLHRFTTTLGPVIYPSLDLATSPTRHLVLVHECQHVVQFYKDPLVFPPKYLADKEYRAGKEAQAILAQLEVSHWLTGKIPTVRTDLPRGIAYGYALNPEDILFAQRILEVGMTMTSNGVYATEVGKIATKWLNQNAHELYHGCAY